MNSQFETDIIVKGIEISWLAWSKMKGEYLSLGDINYLKAEGGKEFERIFEVNITDNTQFRIGRMTALIKAGIMPDSIIITPNTRPDNLAQVLESGGFIINDAGPSMIMYIDDYDGSSQKPGSFEIVNRTSEDMLGEWLNIVTEALFGQRLVTLEQFGDILKLCNTYFYLGLYGGKPVSACMTITGGDTSVLELVATLKEYRRRGFASALIKSALSDLKEKGIKTISLRSEADGVGLYRSLGFKDGFNRIVASCDPKNIYRKSCPCIIGEESIKKA